MATSINTIIDIPDCYEELANILKEKISNYGVDLIKDCTASSIDYNKNLVSCWNMFQSACIAYNNKIYKQAKLLINYIIKTLGLNIEIDDTPIVKTEFKVTLQGNIYYETSGNKEFILSPPLVIDISKIKADKDYECIDSEVEIISGDAEIKLENGVRPIITNIKSDIVITKKTIRSKVVILFDVNNKTIIDVFNVKENIKEFYTPTSPFDLIEEDEGYLAQIHYNKYTLIDEDCNIIETTITADKIDLSNAYLLDKSLILLQTTDNHDLYINEVVTDLTEATGQPGSSVYVESEDAIYQYYVSGSTTKWVLIAKN